MLIGKINFQNTIIFAVKNSGMVFSNLDRTQVGTTSSDHKFGKTVIQVQLAIGRHFLKAFVIVVMPVQHKLNMGLVKNFQNIQHLRVIAMLSGAKDGVMPKGKCASCGVLF